MSLNYCVLMPLTTFALQSLILRASSIFSTSPSTAFLNVPRRLTFVGASQTKSNGDFVKWVPQGSSNCNVAPIVGVAETPVSLGFATFTFPSVGPAMLCYKFGGNAYVLFSNASISVLTAPGLCVFFTSPISC